MNHPRRSEAGLTLVELLVSVVILAMITGALASVFITAFNGSRPTNERIRESNDAQLITAYLERDAQSAGGSNPSFGTLDSTLGISAPSTAPDCTSAGSLIVRFTWRDRSSLVDAPLHVANYFFDATTHEVNRKTCVDGVDESFLRLGSEIAAIQPNGVARCITGGTDADCPSAPAATLPDFVELLVLATNDPHNSPTAYTYKLTASVRPEGQAAPDSSTATLVPLIALGGTCGDGVTGIQAQGGGSSTITVYGGAQVNGGCPAVDFQGSIDFIATGGIGVLAPGTCQGTSSPCSQYSTPIGDPFAALPTPPADCTNGTHAPPSGSTYFPGVYKTLLSVGNATFSPGIYVFCNGLTTNGTVTANGVLFYFTGGTLTVSGGNFSATAQTTGIYGSGANGANIVVWQKSGNAAGLSVCCSNNTEAHFYGTLYAPSAIVTLHNGTITVTSIVAKGVDWEGGGNGSTAIGTPPSSPLTYVGPAALGGWTVNRPYPPVTATASGGSGGNIWTATGLPPGMSIDPQTAVISGTPSAANTYSVTVTVTDSIGEQASRTYTLRINANPAISNPANLPNWTINRDYPGTAIVVSGGTSPFTWSATGLPPGLFIDAFGVVRGTPNTLGTFSSINVTVVDATGVSASRGYSITINSPPSITGPASLPTDVTASVAYPATTVTGTSGTTPYSWSASGLPPGLTIGAASGTISGTPTTAGTYNITVTLRDAAGATATAPYSVTVKPAPGIATSALPVGEIGRPYNFTVQSTGQGQPPFTWTATGLPAGLTIGLNTGTISGTPTVSGTFANVTITITDANGASGSKTLSLVIAAAPTINAPNSLKDWTINRDYPGTQVTATGGVTPFTWSATGLPAGLSMNTSGLISGTPSVTGTFTAIVTVVDSLGGTGTRNYTFTINTPPSITTSSLPDGERTVPYSKAMAATSGTPAYNWAASGLPGGLSINSVSGVLSGTPTVAGSFDITFTVTDVAGASNSTILTLNLFPAPTVDPNTLPNWTVNVPYPSTTLTATGGQAPYTWSATGLPTGLTIGATTGTVSGTPTVANTFSVTVTVTDSLGGTATQVHSVKISAAPTITTASIPSWTVNRPYTNFTMTSAGGTQPITWSATGLPTGLSIDSGTGVISGTPDTLGTFTPTVTALDSVGVTANRSYTVDIKTDPSITTTVLPDGEQNVFYSTTVSGTNGTTPYSWSATGLPGGLGISTGGTISGTPTVTGTFTVTLSLTDAAGASAPSQNVTIRLFPQLLITAPAGASLQPWTINRPYPATTVTATGGTGVYSWTATGLPVGLSINAGTGVISGTPTASGNYTVIVTVTDNASPAVSKNRTYSLTINPALSITTTSCTAQKSKAFSFQLQRTGGTAGFVWSASGLPAWATVNAAGVLSGNAPGSSGTVASFNVTVTDSAGASSTVTFTITVVNGGGSC